MNGSQRFVADTNVLISFILRPSSTPGQAVTTVLERGLMVFSDVTFAEFSDVLKRPKFDPYVPRQPREAVLRLLGDAALHVAPTEYIRACSDPHDDHILEAAVAGGADLILTGDRALLALDPFRDIEILTPAAYLRRA